MQVRCSLSLYVSVRDEHRLTVSRPVLIGSATSVSIMHLHSVTSCDYMTCITCNSRKIKPRESRVIVDASMYANQAGLMTQNVH